MGPHNDFLTDAENAEDRMVWIMFLAYQTLQKRSCEELSRKFAKEEDRRRGRKITPKNGQAVIW